MTTIDSFITQHTAGHLHAGEQVLGYGLAIHQLRRNKIEAFLAAATGVRLLLFESDYKIGFSVSAVAKATRLVEWSYADLADVALGQGSKMMGGHAMLTLIPHAGRGPFAQEPPSRQKRTYQIPTKVKNLGYHESFHQQFPAWLINHVKSGAAAAQVPAPSAFAVGSEVKVAWSDGQRYPARLLAVQGEQGQIQFPDGRTLVVAMAQLSA